LGSVQTVLFLLKSQRI